MNRTVATVLSVTAAVVLLAGAGAWWFLRDDAPEEVDLSAATAGVAQQDSDGSVDGAADGGTFDGDVSGTWSVDTDTGDFDYESATGTFAGFRIAEELAGIGSTTAVGRTGDVSGTMEIDGETVTAASFEVDLTTITTDDSRRDDKVQDALDTSSFPTASFTLTEPIELGSAASTGDPVSVSAIGELTINGVTTKVEFPLDAQVVDGTVVVVGSLDIAFSDYGVEVPSSPIVLSVDDNGTLELQLLLMKN
ncbi:MAG: YceI family protein [Microthrixaceae bacterium]|nr:YceI family protein [Microthrixaceae bacterium]